MCSSMRTTGGIHKHDSFREPWKSCLQYSDDLPCEPAGAVAFVPSGHLSSERGVQSACSATQSAAHTWPTCLQAFTVEAPRLWSRAVLMVGSSSCPPSSAARAPLTFLLFATAQARRHGGLQTCDVMFNAHPKTISGQVIISKDSSNTCHDQRKKAQSNMQGLKIPSQTHMPCFTTFSRLSLEEICQSLRI